MNICTWICEEETADNRLAPSLRPPASVSEREAAWRCAAVFFATSRRHNPLANHVLFTNAPKAPTLDGMDLERFLVDKLQVGIERLPSVTRTPFGFDGMGKKSLYLFDIIRRLARLEDDDRAKYAVIDPACVWIRPFFVFDSQLERNGMLTMAANGPDRRDSRQLRRIYEEMMGGPVPASAFDAPSPCDIVIFAGVLGEIRSVASELERTWAISLERFRRNRPRLRDESEMLGFVFNKLGYRPRTADAFIRTIRTEPGGIRDARPDDRFLTIWHVPDERKRGIMRLYRDAVRTDRMFRSGPPNVFRQYVSRTIGVPRRGGVQYVRDFPALVYRKLRKAGSGKKGDAYG